MIQFSHLTKRFGKFTAVDDLSFTVEPQRALALWGPNGAGKTTAIKCLLGLLRYQGSIQVEGLDAHKQGKAVRRRLGYVPQELAFYSDMSALDTAQFYARLKRAPASRAREVLAQVGLEDHGHKPVGALSGGMKQRLALGLALLADPPVLVLDEPTSNLDAAGRDQFLELLAGVRSAGKTILFTSHRIEEISALADQVLVMAQGRAVSICPAAELPQRLGLRSQLRLYLTEDAIAPAVNILTQGGFTVARNGHGVVVDVLPGQKAAPIHVLRDAAIDVMDFEMQQ
ncbi:MAG TPA: ABC transporter ATP-binding protein [Anaerolineae bacterium]|nr:ABC transporter ATP-binding protein [Anaerolineae bacterium]HNU05017.1 ABC transporter ATP-binding protein [Anaerolineae bacterium]